MTDVTLSMSIDAKGVKSGSDTAVRSLDDIKKSARESAKAIDGYQQSLNVAGNVAASLKSTLAGLASAYGIKEIVETADKYALLNARIRLVNDSQIQAIQVYDRLKVSANNNLSSLEASVNLYTRLSNATKNYAVTQNQIINITDAVSKTFRLSGTSAAEASAGAMQFGQALGSGKLAGDEFRSIAENNIRLINALADGFGVTTGKLREMSEKGLLTTSAILEKLPSQFDKINKEASTLPTTVGGAFSVLKNNILDYIGQTNEANGGTSALADGVLSVANNLDNMGKALIVVTAASIPITFYRIAAAIAAMETATIAATTAMLTNPLFIIATGGAAAIGGIYAFRKEISNLTEGMIQFGKVDAANSVTVIGKALDESGKKIKQYGEALKKRWVVGGRENIQGKLDEEIKNYDRLQDAYDKVTAKSLPLYEGNKKLAASTVGISKEIQTLIDKNKAVGDNYGKSSQRIALETLQSYKLGQEYKKLAASKAAADQESIKSITIAETQLKSAIAQEEAEKELTKQKKELTKAQKEQNDLIERRNELISSYKIDLDQQTRLNAANQNSERMYKVVSDGIERENVLRSVGLTLATKQGQLLDDLIYKKQQEAHGIDYTNEQRKEAIRLQEEELKKQKDLDKKRAEPFVEASKNIQSGIAKSIEEAAREGLHNGFNGNTLRSTFKSFGNLLKDTIITSVSNGLAASVTTGMVAPYLVKFATSLNGKSTGDAVAQALGVKEGSTGGLTGSKELLGSAGIGAGVGGLNLFGGNNVGSTIGGGLGGIGGSLAAAPIAAALGMTLGPIGLALAPVIGGAIGSALGGLFGGGKAVSAAEFAGNITSTGLSGVSVGAKNGDKAQAQGLSDTLGAFLSQIVSSGVNISSSSVRGAINSKSGNRFEVLGQSIGFDPSDANSVASAISKVAVELAKAGQNSGSLAIALQHIQTDGRKAEDVLADINFAANFDKLGEAPKKLTAFEQSVEDLKKQFDAAEETTKRLGLSEEKLAGYRKSQFDLLTTQFNQDISAQILAITDPTASAISELNKAFVDVRKNAAAIGGDMIKVEELYNLKLSQINDEANKAAIAAEQQKQDDILKVKQDAAKEYLSNEISLQTSLAQTLETTKSKFEGFATSLRSFRQGLLTDVNLSPLSNEERFRAAQSQFNNISSLARLGNEDAIGSLQDTSKSYLEAAKDYYGTTAPVFDAVQSALENTESLASRQANIASQQLNAANTQISILTAISNGVNKQQATGAASNPTKYGTDPKISQINYLLDAATDFKFKGNFGGGAFDRFAASGAITDAEREAARNVHRSFGLTPAYANGGDFSGGLRIVGERGAELEATGSSKIINNKTLKDALSGAGNAELIATVQSSDKSNREEIRALRRQLADSEKRNQDMIKELFDRQDRVSGQLISILNKPNVRVS